MNTRNKYFTNFKRGIILLAVYISLGTAIYIIRIYSGIDRDLFGMIESIMRLCRTFSMLGLLAIIGYLVYKGYMYYSSRFFRVSQISVIDAFSNGFIDMAFVYDKLKTVSNIVEIEIDTKNRSFRIETKSVNYSVMVRDYSGKIEGGLNYENWHILSKKRKDHNLVIYKKRIKIDNPFKVNSLLIQDLRLRENKEYENIVLVSSLKKPDIKSDRMVQLYELLEIIGEELQL